MSLTFAQARDEILTLFKTAWDAGAESAGKTVIYPDAKNTVPETNDGNGDPDVWARVSVVHTTGEQATLSNHLGQQRFQRNGIFTAQVFSPIGTGLSIGDNLYKIVVDAFEGKASPGGVWFTNVSVNEIGPEGSWFQTNITADFEYDEQK